MRNLRILLHSRYTYVAILLFLIIYVFVFTVLVKQKSVYVGSEKEFLMEIRGLDIDGDLFNILLFDKEYIRGKYYFKEESEKKEFLNNYHLGDKVFITGNLVKPSNNTNPNMFNYKRYLYRNKQFFSLEIEYISKRKENSNILYSIKNLIISRIDSLKISGPYIRTFLLGEADKIDNDIRNTYNSIGISHLLSMANMHISLVSLVLLLFLKKKSLVFDILIILFSLFALFLMGFSPSAVRTVVFFILLRINKFLEFDISDLKALILSLFFIIILNPFIVYNIGFLYSSIISFFLLLFSKKIELKKNYISKLLMVSYISFLVGLPITIYNFYEINFLSILNNLIFVPLITFIFFPLAVLTFIFPFLDSLMGNFIKLIEIIASVFDISLLSFTFKKLNLLIYFLYYIVIILVLKKPKCISILVVILFIHINYNNIFRSSYMLMIDVGQGDSILFHSNGESVLIDTGGKREFIKNSWMKRDNYYSIARDTLAPLLKSLGIGSLNYLVITHGDYDHAGEAVNLLKEIRVDRLLFNNGGFNKLEEKIFNASKNNIVVNNGNSFNVGEFSFNTYLLNSKDENDNSIILLANINGIKILLMGDASTESEDWLLKNNDIGNVSFIKIGHHGSKTSTSEELIKSTKPRFALISAGRNNKFNHPSSVVIDRLNKYYVKKFVTKYDGAILVKFLKSVTIINYPP